MKRSRPVQFQLVCPGNCPCGNCRLLVIDGRIVGPPFITPDEGLEQLIEATESRWLNPWFGLYAIQVITDLKAYEPVGRSHTLRQIRVTAFRHPLAIVAEHTVEMRLPPSPEIVVVSPPIPDRAATLLA